MNLRDEIAKTHAIRDRLAANEVSFMALTIDELCELEQPLRNIVNYINRIATPAQIAADPDVASVVDDCNILIVFITMQIQALEAMNDGH